MEFADFVRRIFAGHAQLGYFLHDAAICLKSAEAVKVAQDSCEQALPESRVANAMMASYRRVWSGPNDWVSGIRCPTPNRYDNFWRK